MLHTRTHGQSHFEMVNIEDLVDKNHLLRKVAATINFSFIIEKVRDLYCPDNGRPSVDPVMLFKMLLIGYLFGVPSETRLVEEIKHNIAYRWFLGLGLTDKVPSAAAIWQNRRRRWRDSTIFQEIFDEIVRQGVQAGLIDGRVLFTDSTLIKANANKKRYLLQQVPESTKAYLGELDRAIEEDREVHGKKTLARRKEVAPKTREVKISTTDPDSGYIHREGKPECFGYSEHRTVDRTCNMVIDVHVTPANVHDSVPYTDRMDRITRTFGFEVEAVALDSGYNTAPIAHYLVRRGIFGVFGHRRFHTKKNLFRKTDFKYDPDHDVYRCPNDQLLVYRTTNREGYREYRSNPEVCRTCFLRPGCTQAANCAKTITRHVWEDDREQLRANKRTDWGKELYALRKETVERSFADAKRHHGMRYARMRGIARMQEQSLMTAAAQNIKKLALILDRRLRRATTPPTTAA